jgi:hypothetical protein
VKLNDVREIFYFNTGKVSDIIRQIGLAGLAVIWVFRTQAPGGGQVIPKQLFLAGTLILLSLSVDLLQYALATIIWERFNKRKEQELRNKSDPEEEDFEAPEHINFWPDTLFWTKFVLIVIAYVVLISYLARHIL